MRFETDIKLISCDQLVSSNQLLAAVKQQLLVTQAVPDVQDVCLIPVFSRLKDNNVQSEPLPHRSHH